MEPNRILNEMLAFNRASLKSCYDMFFMMQDQVEHMTDALLDNMTWFPKEEKKLAAEWVKDMKKGRETQKKPADTNPKKTEEIIPA